MSFRKKRSWARNNTRKTKRVVNFNRTMSDREKEWRELYPEAFRKRGRHVNRHHMTNKCRGGGDGSTNILMMKIDRHRKLHELFKNMSWEQIHDTLKSIFGVGDPTKVIAVMERVSQMKGRVA